MQPNTWKYFPFPKIAFPKNIYFPENILHEQNTALIFCRLVSLLNFWIALSFFFFFFIHSLYLLGSQDGEDSWWRAWSRRTLLFGSAWFFQFCGFSLVYLTSSTSLSPWSSISLEFEVVSPIVLLNFVLTMKACQLGKHHRLPFISRCESRVNSPFYLFHFDIWGLINTPSLLGFRCFVTFLSYERKVWNVINFQTIFYGNKDSIKWFTLYFSIW